MNITETNRGFELRFKYNEEIKNEVKAITGSYFRSADKVWVVPKYMERQVELLRSKYKATDAGANNIENMPLQIGPVQEMPELDIELPLVKRELFPFQKNGVAYNRLHKKTIIGDQPGLGKTTQAIATIMSYGLNEKGMLNAGPVLIICPSSLKLNWQAEWNTVAGRRSMILTDRIKNTWMKYYEVGMCDVFITNYESLKKFFVVPGWTKPKEGQFRMNQIPFRECVDLFKTVIVDESHKCKDGNTQQTKFVMAIAKGKEFVFELTGTPLVNKPMDLISQLHIVDRLRDIVAHIPQPLDQHGKRTDWGGYQRFVDRYCSGEKKASNLEELSYRLRKFCFYRREKSEVLKDLPAKMRQIVLTEITNMDEYKTHEENFKKYLAQLKRENNGKLPPKAYGDILANIGKLKQISARGKMPQVQEYIDEIVDSGEKVIVFCSLRVIGDMLQEKYPKAVMIRGGMSDQEKDYSVKQFQTNPDVQIIICSIKAAGVGLNLTASSRVAFIEFPWTYADCEQCEDRAHRIGQLDSVQCPYFLGNNTIDQHCYEIIQRKKNMSLTVTGANDDVEENMVNALVNLFTQETVTNDN